METGICVYSPDRGLRRLAAARILEEVQRCLHDEPMGLPYLAAWFQGDGREWLDLAGLSHLSDVSAGELARRVFQFAPDLFRAQRCAYCVHLVGNGRVRCELGVWEEEWGMRGEYAAATVQHSSKRFPGCDLFEKRKGTSND